MCTKFLVWKGASEFVMIVKYNPPVMSLFCVLATNPYDREEAKTNKNRNHQEWACDENNLHASYMWSSNSCLVWLVDAEMSLFKFCHKIKSNDILHVIFWLLNIDLDCKSKRNIYHIWPSQAHLDRLLPPSSVMKLSSFWHFAFMGVNYYYGGKYAFLFSMMLPYIKIWYFDIS